MPPLFEVLRAAAIDHPIRPALVTSEGQLTYEDLVDRSLRLAGGLRNRGIEPGSRVALWAPKRLETYVSLYAALAAGAAYVPIEIASPPARAAWIMADADVEVLFCRAFDAARLPLPLPKSLRLIVLVDSVPGTRLPVPAVSWKDLQNWFPAGFLGENGSDRDLAYILYTSGSTGTPRGAAISHGAARTFVDWAGDFCGLSPEDRVSNQADLSFDLSIFDLFATARAGAALVPVPQWPGNQGYPFTRFIEEQAITVWYSVPTILDRIANSQKQRHCDLGSLRAVVFAGEVFSKPKLRLLRTVLPQPRLLNWYGPTETNVCTYYEIRPSDLRKETLLPIGQPCPYAEVFVSDPAEGLGELVVGGRSLMEGYWRSDGIDASVFQTLPDRPGRFYPTGDLASQRSDGELLFHGRGDSQIKLGGFRIELGEIERALESLPRVTEAVVLCTVEGDILAFVETGSAATRFSEPEIRQELAQRLPPYMVPQSIRSLLTLPRTARGKIDRQALFSLAGEIGERVHG